MNLNSKNIEKQKDNRSIYKRENNKNCLINKAKNVTMENVLCALIILCPIFDCMSFIFRNFFKTEISASTFIRPIIPIIVGIIIFIKSSNKEKIKYLLLAFMYIGYGIIHLLVTKSLITGCSYGTLKNEMQYIFNFTFLIIYLIIFQYVFINKKNDTKKIKKALMIMLSIYIGSIFLAIITKTSSYTYSETKTGFKGWIESRK